MRIIVLGNCQTRPLAKMLNYQKRHIVHYVFVHTLNSEQIIGLSAEMDNFDIIITQLLSEKYGDLATGMLEEKYPDKIVKIHNLFFEGLQPDNVALPIPGPTVGHSRIILWSFFHGKTIDECSQMFSRRWYEKIGFFNAWEYSMNNLLQREKNIDVPFANELEMILRERLSFFTYNHPTKFILLQYAQKISDFIGIRQQFLSDDCYVDYLLSETIWPVYEELAIYHQLSYKGSYVWGRGGEQWMSLEEMIRLSYTTFSKNFDKIKGKVDIENTLYFWKR